MTRPLSVLDLAPVTSGSTAAQTFKNSVELARLAERLGYARYWFAEHHGMPGIASSSPEILIGHVAGATERIRVGSGGIMLPNHVALRVAETFLTLEALYPNRIDLGIGRAPGTDPWTARVLRRFNSNEFASHLRDLIALPSGDFPEEHPLHRSRAMPAGVDLPPIWLLGSSGASASFAGSLGLGYAFASHFSPDPPEPAMEAYFDAFRPSKEFPAPHALLAVSVVCAETEAEADALARPLDLAWIRIRNGEFLPLATVEEATNYPYSAFERAVAAEHRTRVFVGTPDEVRQRIDALATRVAASEVMITSMMSDHTARMRSYELLSDAYTRG